MYQEDEDALLEQALAMSMTEGVGAPRSAREDTTMTETDQDLAFGEFCNDDLLLSWVGHFHPSKFLIL